MPPYTASAGTSLAARRLPLVGADCAARGKAWCRRAPEGDEGREGVEELRCLLPWKSGAAAVTSSSRENGEMPQQTTRLVEDDVEKVGSDLEIDSGDGADRATAVKRGGSGVHSSPPKSRRGDEVVFPESMLRSLLADTQAAILKAQDATIKTAMSQLEHRQESRFQDLEKSVEAGTKRQDVVEAALHELQARLAKVEEGSTTASTNGQNKGVDEQRRKLTLILGGFPRDSRRKQVVDTIAKLLRKHKLRDLCDEEPFTTGPRRSVALLPFRVRNGEGPSDARARMHRVLGVLSKAREALEGSDRVLWVGVSKTKEERARSTHCTFVRSLVRQLQPASLDLLEHDYQEGTTWIGDDVVASMNLDPPKIDSYKLFSLPKEGMKKDAWLNLSLLAHALKLPFDQVESTATRSLH